VRDQVVLANLNLAKLMWRKDDPKRSVRVEKLKQDADSMGLKAESVQASITWRALLATKTTRTPRARS